MPQPCRYWADLVSRDFAGLDPQATVAVLPVGAVEQHGPHLPLAVDRTLVDAMVTEALERLPPACPVLVLPTQAVGYSPEHMSFAGTLSLSTSTLLATWIELGECVARAGLKKLLIFNSHGGQAGLLDVAARELRAKAQLLVYGCSWWNLPAEEAWQDFGADEQRFGIHAGDIETSLMLHICPSAVDVAQTRHFDSTSRERAEAFSVLGNGRSAKLGWLIEDYNAAGAVGNAAAATAAKGQALLETTAQHLATLLQEFSALPLSTAAARPLNKKSA